MRVINLCHGEGNGVNTACLMMATNMLIGRGQDGDDAKCVCPVLRRFIIATNDGLPEDKLGELYGDLAWEIIGTRTNDLQVMLKRTFAMVDWLVRVVSPIALRSQELNWMADTVSRLQPVTDEISARNAYDMIGLLHGADFHVRDMVMESLDRIQKLDHNRLVLQTHDQHAMGLIAEWVGDCAVGLMLPDADNECPALIRRVAAIGDKRPVEAVLTRDQLCDALGG